MPQPLVLAIEPDLRQAAIVKRIVKEKALADIAVVDSRDAAIEAMRTSMPDVLLLSALLSPRDEDELIAHLRTLDNAGHLQTNTIPQLASAIGPGEGRASRGLLSAFRRKKEPEPVAAGCDPDLFAEEIRVYLQRAADKKRELQNATPAARAAAAAVTTPAQTVTDTHDDSSADASSSWSSPFEWKPTAARSQPQPEHHATVEPEQPVAAAAEAPAVDAPTPEPLVVEAAPEVIPVGVAEVPASDVLTADPHVVEAVRGSLVSELHSALEPEPLAASPAEPIEATAQVEEILEEPVTIAAAPAMAPALDVADTFDNLTIQWVEPDPDPEPAPEPVASDGESVVMLDVAAPPPPVRRHEPVADRAERIAARVQESLTPFEETDQNAFRSQWTRDDRAIKARIVESLGPLARWARTETSRKDQAPAPVTSDDVRALIASLALPPAVASVTYAKGCRIRRVRVPAAAGSEPAQAVGPVILSRRALAEQRDGRAATS